MWLRSLLSFNFYLFFNLQKSTYYDEFKNFILKLYYIENGEYFVIRFKVGLNKEISSKMSIHEFSNLNYIFEAAIEVERELKEEKIPKCKGISS